MERRDFLRLAGASAATLAIGAGMISCNLRNRESVLGVEESENEGVSAGVPINFTEDVDVLIIGSGIAGLSAAMDPSEAGLSVIIADKLNTIGGESFTATGVMYVSGTNIQRDAGIATSVEDAWEKRAAELKAAGNDESLDLEELLFTTGTDWVNRIVADYNASFADPKTYVGKGSPDTFLIPKNGIGDMTSVMSPIKDKLASQGVTFMLGMRAIDFILDGSSKAVGMRFYDTNNRVVTDVRAKKVIVASGGFAANQEMMRSNIPTQAILACLTTFAVGEGHTLCQTLGGQLTGMDKVSPLTGDLPQVEVWGLFGPVLDVSSHGKRIAAEDQIGASALACANQEFGYWWTIFDKQLSDNGQSKSVSYVNGKSPKRVIGPFDTVEDLAEAMLVPKETLASTFEEYDKMVSNKKDTSFGKTTFLQSLSGPYYAVKQFPNRFRTYGGVSTDTDAHVLDSGGAAFSEAFCCGACAKGSYGGIPTHAAYGMIAGQVVTSELLSTENDKQAEPAESDTAADQDAVTDPGDATGPNASTSPDNVTDPDAVTGADAATSTDAASNQGTALQSP